MRITINADGQQDYQDLSALLLEIWKYPIPIDQVVIVRRRGKNWLIRKTKAGFSITKEKVNEN